MAHDKFVWYPTEKYLNSRAGQFMARHHIPNWQELVSRSTQDTQWFWDEALKDLDVVWDRPYEKTFDDSRGLPFTSWFRGGEMNLVRNVLDKHIRLGCGEKTAIVFVTDDGTVRTITYRALERRVKNLARALKHAGLRPGDRMAMCMRTSIEAVVVMLAAFKIGAVCMQPSARFSPEKMTACLKAAGPRILFVHDGYVRGGQQSSLQEIHREAAKSVESLEEIVVVERIGNGLTLEEKSVLWDKFLRRGRGKRFPDTVPLDPEEFALILYSSGTTGVPKTIIHSHAGALVQPIKEIGYYFDCRKDDVFFWATDVGWMMWPWEVVGALFFGATVLLYEGTHLYPTPERIFQLIEKYGVTIFGFTPPAMKKLRALSVDSSKYDLSSLRYLGSTGSRLDQNTWTWFFETFGRGRIPIINITGGTEIDGCHLMSSAMVPQKPGSVGGPALGMDVDAVDENGEPVRGKPGYLVCKKPAPSMTRGFWRDQRRYINTYFPWGLHVWVHGDIAQIDEDGYWDLLGKADDVIIRNGIKIDPEEVDSALLSLDIVPKVIDAVTVGASDPMLGQKIVCFVVIGPTTEMFLLESFLIILKNNVAKKLEKGWRPDEIHVVSAIPRNQAAKTPRRILRAAYEGEELGDVSDTENAQALDEIKRLGRIARSDAANA